VKFWQLIKEGFRVALHSLKTHRLRTFLAMIGVAIGIFAITIIFTFVDSMTYGITKNLSQMGNRVFFVHHVAWLSDGDFDKFFTRPQVSYKDYLRLKENLEGVDGVCYQVELNRHTLKAGEKSLEKVDIRAVTEDFGEINDLKYAFGRPLTREEMDGGRNVCVVGFDVAEQLFGAEEAIGKEVFLLGKRVKIEGVLERTGKDFFGQSKDDLMLVPYAFGGKVFNMRQRLFDKLIIIRASSEDRVDQVESDVMGLMRISRGLRPRSENNFAINKPEMLMNAVGNIMSYLYVGGIIICIFSMIVGGFGIGNIMYTAVKERTFEIGVQKSLGATRAFILYQFLIESLILCLIGGALGIVFELLVVAALQAIMNAADAGFTIIFSTFSFSVGVGFSAVIGILSGLLPSISASRLDPVESMRTK
jgi:putative ABC transport system permease protein